MRAHTHPRASRLIMGRLGLINYPYDDAPNYERWVAFIAKVRSLGWIQAKGSKRPKFELEPVQTWPKWFTDHKAELSAPWRAHLEAIHGPKVHIPDYADYEANDSRQ